jgi:hypothetical protein
VIPAPLIPLDTTAPLTTLGTTVAKIY